MEEILIQINKVGLKFLSPLPLQEIYQLIVREAVKLVDGAEGTLYVAEKDNLKRVCEYPKHKFPKYQVRKKGFTYYSYQDRKVFVIPEDEMLRIHPELKGMGYKSAICIPLADHEKSIGTVLVLSRHTYSFTNKYKEALKTFGSYASLAIRQAKLFEDKEQALQMRDFFISMAAHELRTPLTAVNGYIQLLHRKLESGSNNEAKWIKNLLWESQRLTLLINELLEIDQIKTGKLHFQWSYKNLSEVIDRATNNLKFIFPKRTIVFENTLTDSEDVFIGDFDKILQALTNLLENAAKFSKEDTDIIITLSADDQKLYVSVQDFGVGIPEEIIPKLFEGYAIHTPHEIQGMGLGLYLVKNILKLHQGEIKIDTKEQEGTTVTISLPKAN